MRKQIDSKTAAFILLTIVAAIAWVMMGSPAHDARSTVLGRDLRAFMASKDTEIKLAKVTEFEWTEVCPYLPHSIPTDQPFKVDGYTLRSQAPSTASSTDWYWLFKDATTHEAFFVTPLVDFSRRHEKQMGACLGQDAVLRKAERGSIYLK